MSENFRDGYLDRKSDFGELTSKVQLVADNQSVVLDSLQGFLRLTSDDTTAANRTFTVTNGNVDGQKLHIVLESGSSTSCQLASGGNIQLNGGTAWAPVQWQTISLIWNGTYWIELARTA